MRRDHAHGLLPIARNLRRRSSRKSLPPRASSVDRASASDSPSATTPRTTGKRSSQWRVIGDVDRLLLVAVGRGPGSVLLYLTPGLSALWLGLDFPYGTLIVKVTGSFLIGLVQALADEAAVIPEPARLFLSAGVMGGFTTYSAFSYETVRLVELDAWGRALANVVVTTLVCLGVCVLGIAGGRFVLSLRG